MDTGFPGIPSGQPHHQPHLHQVSEDLSEEADVHELSDASHWPGHTLSSLHNESSTSSHGKIYSGIFINFASKESKPFLNSF